MAHKMDSIYNLALYRKSLPTPALGLPSPLQMLPPDLAQATPPSQGGGGGR